MATKKGGKKAAKKSSKKKAGKKLGTKKKSLAGHGKYWEEPEKRWPR